MAVTTTATLTSAMQTYYDNRFLAYFKENTQVIEQGQKRPVPLNSGKTIDFFRYHPYALVTSSGTEGSVGSEVATEAMNLTATLVIYKNFTKISEFLRLTSRDRNLENIVDLMAQNAAESLEWVTQKEIALYGATYVRGDSNVTYQFNFTATGSTLSHGGTTSIISSSFEDAGSPMGATDNTFIGSVVTILRGKNYGQSRLISDSDDGDAVVIWETAMVDTNSIATIQAGTTEQSGWLCMFREVALSSKAVGPDYSGGTGTTDRGQLGGMHLKAVFDAVEKLEQANAPKYSDGMYHGIIDPIAKGQLMNDSSIVGYWQQSRPRKMEKNALGEIGGVMWFLTTMPMRLQAGHAAYAIAKHILRTSGKLYVSWVFGKNAFGVTELSGRRRKINVKTPGPQSVSVPNDEYSTVGWKSFFVAKALNSTYAIAIVTYQA